MMKSLLCLFIVGFAAVLADNYLCVPEGHKFECYEYASDRRTCLTDHRGTSYVVCSKCKQKYEFCTTRGAMVESDHPEYHCGADYAKTPCTPANSHVPSVLSYNNGVKPSVH